MYYLLFFEEKLKKKPVIKKRVSKKAVSKWSKPVQYTILSLAVFAFLTVSVMVYSFVALSSSGNPDKELKVRVPNNTSIVGIVDIFNENEALKPGWFFKIAAKIYARQSGRTVPAGYHRFPKGMANGDILRSLFAGDNLYLRRVTFPEGISLLKFASIAEKELNIDSAEFIKIAKSPSMLNKFHIDFPNPEGYLMPATYNFFLDEKPVQVVTALFKAQEELWNDKFAKAAREKGLSKHEVLTMASIVEAESPVDDERPIVAGVYYNRLRVGMLLQADPTVQYALGAKRRVSYKDLKFDNKYNTYVYRGLPPGPIGAPGETAIQAAIFPDNNSYLYFVAVGDGSGKHNFSRNLNQHNKFVREYRKRLGR